MKPAIVGLKELRENINKYITQVKKGESFVVVRKSKPIFKISPTDELELWEEVIDFSKIKQGGVNIKDILARL